MIDSFESGALLICVGREQEEDLLIKGPIGKGALGKVCNHFVFSACLKKLRFEWEH